MLSVCSAANCSAPARPLSPASSRTTAEDALQFPATIGPFTMTPVKLAGAFNAFYRQHQFPKPDPSSDENSMAGLDPAIAGLGRGDIIFCQLSPLHKITLDVETKQAANIPKEASYFAWAYPMVQDGLAMTAAQMQTGEGAFLQFGGYIYFNDSRDAVGTNSIRPADLGAEGLMFGRSQILHSAVAETLTRQGRFQEITLEPLTKAGATHFAWIRPQEFSDSVASPNGCFAYKFANGSLKYFPVVTKPIFTRDLLQESLDENDAWVVVRTTQHPQIEELIIFDKSQTLDENISANTHAVTVTGSMEGVFIGKDSQAGLAMTYEQFSCMADPGSIADPWIINVEQQGRA